MYWVWNIDDDTQSVTGKDSMFGLTVSIVKPFNRPAKGIVYLSPTCDGNLIDEIHGWDPNHLICSAEHSVLKYRIKAAQLIAGRWVSSRLRGLSGFLKNSTRWVL